MSSALQIDPMNRFGDDRSTVQRLKTCPTDLSDGACQGMTGIWRKRFRFPWKRAGKVQEAAGTTDAMILCFGDAYEKCAGHRLNISGINDRWHRSAADHLVTGLGTWHKFAKVFGYVAHTLPAVKNTNHQEALITLVEKLGAGPRKAIGRGRPTCTVSSRSFH